MRKASRPTLSSWADGWCARLDGIAAGWLKVPIEGVFPLAAEMHRRLEGRHVAGKLLLKA